MCNKPVDCWEMDGKISMHEIPSYTDEFGVIHSPRVFKVACGHCFACRKSRIRDWTLRLSLEASQHEQCCFVTLTYDPEHLPPGGTLVKRDYQLFLKSLRKKYGKFRYFICGEYGSKRGRPHYHLLLFGLVPPDLRLHCSSESSGELLYCSDEFSRIWSRGIVVIGEVTTQSIAYVARYVNKKLIGVCKDVKQQFYGERIPEFISMSLKPGIGELFYRKYKSDFFPKDYFMWNGYRYKPPRYFEKLWRREVNESEGYLGDGPTYYNFKQRRINNAIAHSEKCTATDLGRSELYLEERHRREQKQRIIERFG